MTTRWFVEVSPVDEDTLKERYCVEAAQWQQALQTTRKMRGDGGPLSRFSIELLDNGYRALDPSARMLYSVSRAPDDAPLTAGAPAPSVPPGSFPPPREAVRRGPPTAPGCQLLSQREEDPTPSVPIAYREYAYAVTPGSSEPELRTALIHLLQQVQEALARREPGKYVQIALFDHAFSGTPRTPPIAVLAWKDWRGKPVVHVEPQNGAPPAPRPAPPSPLPPKETAPLPPKETAPSPPEVAIAAPAQRVRRGPGEDLIGELFDRMHALRFMPDLVSGAEYILDALSTFLPCEAVVIHVYDINTAEFVVVRAAGPNSEQVLLHRTRDKEPLFREALRHGRCLRLDQAEREPRYSDDIWAKLGIRVLRALCGPVQSGGRYLGMIELANPLTEDPFYDSEMNALDYICEQFADFIVNRPVVLSPALVLPRA